MGFASAHSPALLLTAVTSRHPDALAWANRRAQEAWGPLGLVSPVFDFTETDYYRLAMGERLKKQFLAFQRPFDPAELAEIKLATNAWEAEYTEEAGHAEPRPLNLDPGYLTPAKLVLASTKDHSHRIYLSQGVYAEVTLHYQSGAWQPREWTYPDYRRADFHEFFLQLRRELQARQRGGAQA
ncbi:MAG TPA: DUF4416 family protein [Pirellulales bacterium]|nr:DUF4416 family protein [Pirellulales bacterium]